MDYSQLSDFEINKRVAIATGQNIKFIFLDDDDNEIGVLVGRKGCREKKDFDPCNNAADAWPIIESNFIALHPLKHKSVWIGAIVLMVVGVLSRMTLQKPPKDKGDGK